MSGEVMTVNAACVWCGEEKKIDNIRGWDQKEKCTSGKRGPCLNWFNIETVAAAFLNGGTYNTYLHQRNELGLHAMSRKGYHAAEKEVISAIE
jgi:hypothetical protein